MEDAEARPTFLWGAKRLKIIDTVAARNELFALWKQGKLTGGGGRWIFSEWHSEKWRVGQCPGLFAKRSVSRPLQSTLARCVPSLHGFLCGAASRRPLSSQGGDRSLTR